MPNLETGIEATQEVGESPSTTLSHGNFDALLARLPSEPKARGDEFERVVQWFLKTTPVYASEFREVWLWDDWPERYGIDKGIDLVAETHEGKLWAIQAKGYDPNNRVPPDHIDSFISESARSIFSHRLLISTGNVIKVIASDSNTAFGVGGTARR